MTRDRSTLRVLAEQALPAVTMTLARAFVIVGTVADKAADTLVELTEDLQRREDRGAGR